MITPVRQWLPERRLVVATDSSDAAIELLSACHGLPMPVSLVTRLRVDAALSDPAPLPFMRGCSHLKGAHQPTLAARLSDPVTVWQEINRR